MTTKDEIKNRISLELKDPVLQQGFEIICRENAELEKIKRDCETAGLKAGKDMNVATKWHDLLRNPTDVPKENVTVLLLTEVEPVTARYYNEYEAFFRLNDKLDYCIFIAPMSYIAWCDIPRYMEDKTKEQPSVFPAAEHEC